MGRLKYSAFYFGPFFFCLFIGAKNKSRRSEAKEPV